MSSIGGSIKAENGPEGGAVFTLTFSTITERRSSTGQLSPRAAPGQRILVVDDDLEHLQTAKAVIELEEQEVDVAESGRAALERFQSGTSYDLVLCDAGMPGLNGWQVAEQIRAIAPGTRVYLLTGWAQQIADDDPRRHLVSGILPKPMNLDRLRQLLAPGEATTLAK
jgi:CheY-like chemotaxis protein